MVSSVSGCNLVFFLQNTRVWPINSMIKLWQNKRAACVLAHWCWDADAKINSFSQVIRGHFLICDVIEAVWSVPPKYWSSIPSPIVVPIIRLLIWKNASHIITSNTFILSGIFKRKLYVGRQQCCLQQTLHVWTARGDETQRTVDADALQRYTRDVCPWCWDCIVLLTAIKSRNYVFTHCIVKSVLSEFTTEMTQCLTKCLFNTPEHWIKLLGLCNNCMQISHKLAKG